MTIKPGNLQPLLIIDLGIGVFGFMLSLLWGKISRREMDRDTVLFLAKMFGGISVLGMVLAFIM